MVDPVRDQLTLGVYGGRPMRILFDARTQFYRDGKKITAADLQANDRASVETVLDGTNVFALTVHMLSRAPEGQYQGQLVEYNPSLGELTMRGGLSREPFRVLVPAGTTVVREGQAAASSVHSSLADLVPGSLLSVKFESGNQGRGVATQISILATPGSVFRFSGSVSFLDLHSGVLVLADPQEDQSYQISFDPARFPEAQDLHQGDHVSTTASFDGERYVASTITKH